MICTLPLPDLAATESLAACLAPRLGPGDTLLLSGDIGAGKSAFARALIRARLGREVEVPSPTYTLVQTYADEAEVEIWHADLYRMSDPQELAELGLEAAMEEAICLIEWPDRLEAPPAAPPLSLAFAAGDPAHSVEISAGGGWADRIGACLD